MKHDEIIALAKKHGATLLQPYDYGAKPDTFVITFTKLEKIAQEIRNEAIKEAQKHILAQSKKTYGCLLQEFVECSNLIGDLLVDTRGHGR